MGLPTTAKSGMNATARRAHVFAGLAIRGRLGVPVVPVVPAVASYRYQISVVQRQTVSRIVALGSKYGVSSGPLALLLIELLAS